MSFQDYLTPLNLFLATVGLANGLAGSFFYFIWRSLKKSVQADIMKKVDEHKAAIFEEMQKKTEAVILKVEEEKQKVIDHLTKTEDTVREKLEQSDKEVTETLSEQDKQSAVVLEKLDNIGKSQDKMQEGITKTCTTVETLNKGLNDHILESTKDRTDLRAKVEANTSILHGLKFPTLGTRRRSSPNKAKKLRR